MRRIIQIILFFVLSGSFVTKAQIWNKWYPATTALGNYAVWQTGPHCWDSRWGGLIAVDYGTVSKRNILLQRLDANGDTLWSKNSLLNGYNASDVKTISRLSYGDFLIAAVKDDRYFNLFRLDSLGNLTFFDTILISPMVNSNHIGWTWDDIKAAPGDSGSYFVVYRLDTLRSGTIPPSTTYDSVATFLITEKYDRNNIKLYADTLTSGGLFNINGSPLCPGNGHDAISAGYMANEIRSAPDGGLICVIRRDSSMEFSPNGCRIKRPGIRKGGAFVRKLDRHLHEEWTTDLQDAMHLPFYQGSYPGTSYATSDSGCIMFCLALDTNSGAPSVQHVVKLNRFGQPTDSLKVSVAVLFGYDVIETSSRNYIMRIGTFVRQQGYVPGLAMFDRHLNFLSYTPWAFWRVYSYGMLSANNVGGGFCHYVAYTDTGSIATAWAAGSLSFDSLWNEYPCTLNGKIILDNNADCINNSGDLPLRASGVTLLNTNTGRYNTFFPNSAGAYSAHGDFGNYLVSHSPARGKRLICPPGGYGLTMNSLTPYNNYDFYDSLIQSGKDMAVNIAPCRFVSGFDSYLQFFVTNNGNVTTSDTVQLQLPTGILYVSATPTPVSIVGNTLTWVLNNVTFDSTVSVAVTLRTSTALSISTPLNVIATVSKTQDIFTFDNTDTLSTIVYGAFDPNDKSVNHSRYTSANNDLVYKIEFQNTGNYPAKDILVTDAIDEQLDLATLHVLAATHGMPQVICKEDNVVHFRFNNINLPDSVHNEPGSHGSFVYSISPKKTVVVGDTITNTASIYFDFNSAIVTGTTMNIISQAALEVSTGPMQTAGITAYPNPTSGTITVNTTQSAVLTLNDMMGRTLAGYEIPAGRSQIKIPFGTPPGIYFLRTRANNQHHFRAIKIIYQP